MFKPLTCIKRIDQFIVVILFYSFCFRFSIVKSHEVVERKTSQTNDQYKMDMLFCCRKINIHRWSRRSMARAQRVIIYTRWCYLHACCTWVRDKILLIKIGIFEKSSLPSSRSLSFGALCSPRQLESDVLEFDRSGWVE